MIWFQLINNTNRFALNRFVQFNQFVIQEYSTWIAERDYDYKPANSGFAELPFGDNKSKTCHFSILWWVTVGPFFDWSAGHLLVCRPTPKLFERILIDCRHVLTDQPPMGLNDLAGRLTILGDLMAPEHKLSYHTAIFSFTIQGISNRLRRAIN